MVLFLDSGIGGLPYCGAFAARNPSSSVLYFADSAHFPYGAKTKEELCAILVFCIRELVARFSLELVVVACNTASVSALDALRRAFPSLPFVGTVPAVKPALEKSRKKAIGVLGTERTIADPYIDALASRCKSGCRIEKIAAPELVLFIENQFFDAADGEKRRAAAPYIKRFCALDVDGVVLGCTHFLFLQNEFRAEAGCAMDIFDSIDGVVRRAESLLQKPSGQAKGGELSRVPGKRLLLASGGGDGFWEKRAAEFGMELLRETGLSAFPV